ncbi:MAG: molybdopterin molybdotransferase MoeA [Eggerthellaceae bacterium]|nr:molybdopterin molybdotransferase MoeA [Eggerthellaceae bacterium]
MTVAEMISLEEAQQLVLSSVKPMHTETVSLLDAVGRIAATDVISDINVSPFDHAAMDGFALRSAQVAGASSEQPVQLRVIAEVAAGDFFDGEAAEGECVRIMTGAPVPAWADTVVKYEIVRNVEGDGRLGSLVEFSAPSEPYSNIRLAGEEAKVGEPVVTAGELISSAGAGFVASCGAVEVSVYARPRVGIIAIGSELVEPPAVPGPGKIRNSNSYAMAACAQAAGAIPVILPIVEDTLEALTAAVDQATREYDFVVTTGGASNGDFDFIKPVVEQLGELKMTSVNMRPGKAQTFGIVNGTPVFGLPGNPAAAYCGFELIIRPGLRKMQGFPEGSRPVLKAAMAKDQRKKDPRRIFLRGTLERTADGLVFTPAKNQSSGSFGAIQRANCMGVMPEGLESKKAGDLIDCILLDVPENAFPL